MDSFIEDNSSYVCAYCAQELGSLPELMDSQILANHDCLKNSENVTVDNESKKIYCADADGEKNDSECSSRIASSSRHLHDAASISTSSLTTHAPELWTDNSVKLLIDIYREHKNKFDMPTFTKKKVWEIISSKLNQFGYNKTGVKCDEKWRNLRKTYDKVRTEMGKTGNSKVTWKFFQEFQEIYWRDPHFLPVATASSTAKFIKRKVTDNDSTSENDIVSAKTKKLCPGEKKKKTFTAADIEIRRQKRHEEKMNLKREIFEWFKNNHKQRDSE